MIQIVTFTTSDPSAPAAMRCCAAMVADQRPGSHWLATGPTEDAARATLEALWLKAYPAEKRARKAEAMDLV